MSTMPNTNPASDSRSVAERSVARFTNVDVGSPQMAGSATPVGTGWDLVAGGVDIWENADQFHFVFQEFSGDFDIAARVESFIPAHLYSKAGLMIRESLDAASAHVMFFLFSKCSFVRSPETIARPSIPQSGLLSRRTSPPPTRTPGCGWRDAGISSGLMHRPMARPGSCTVRKF